MKNDILFKLLTKLVIRQNADFAFVNICNCFNITFVFNLVENKKTGIPKVTLKVINQDRMFFVDFSVNCQPIFMKFGNNHISAES